MNAGRTLIALLILVGGAGALFDGAPIFSRILYLGLLIVICGWLWTAWIARALRVKRHARLTRVTVGEIFEEHFEISNQSRLIAPWLEIGNKTRVPFAAGSRLLTFVRGKQTRQYLARTWLQRRGGYELGPTVLTVGDPFGLFRVRRRFPAEQSLIVFPMLIPIQSFISPPGILPGGQVIRRKSSDITPHAAGVREYSYGDAMKRIHWPTSIRRGQLMVKEFEQDPQSEIWLVLDAQSTVHVEKPYTPSATLVDIAYATRLPKLKLPPSTLEYAITITASLAHYYLQHRRTVGFMSSGHSQTMLSADRSERQEGKILETLAFIEADGEMSLPALVQAQAGQLPQGSSAILVTPTVQPELLAAVDDLRRRHLRPVVILLVAESFGGMKGSDRLIQALAERKTPVCPIYCDADLSAALSGFAAQTAQEALPWQKPRSYHST
jgi:uncharacterized protein (DUF58 family)